MIKRHCLIVLGMHRSGTSALAGVLALSGAEPGPSLMPAVDTVNPKGFWEHAEVVAIHDEMLAALGAAWDDERVLPCEWWTRPEVIPFRKRIKAVLEKDFGQSELWVLKDPRMCRLMPLWFEVLGELAVEPRFVICLRSPAEVAQSLYRRDGMPEARANTLWLEHVLESERVTRCFPRILVTYDQLLDDWKTTVRTIAEGLSLPLSVDEAAERRLDEFLEPSLRHHVAGERGNPDDRLSELASFVYDEATSMPLDEIRPALDAVAKEVGDFVGLITPWAGQIIHLQEQVKSLSQEQADKRLLEEEVKRIKRTFSWRITAPLRAIRNILRVHH